MYDCFLLTALSRTRKRMAGKQRGRSQCDMVTARSHLSCVPCNGKQFWFIPGRVVGELMLEVKKIAEDLYVAIATPPEVDEVWFTPEPLSARRLIKQLSNRGGHSTDIADAMNQQDPQWIEKAQGPYE